MKYALCGQDRIEASRGARGVCPCCGAEMIAKCGEIKVKHWAHKGIRSCDAWWENETEWHRSWKNRFLEDFQEIVHYSGCGEKHIADVKTPHGWVIEFQHSYLNPDERRSRNEFYEKLCWLVDGRRRKRDWEQFRDVVKKAHSPPGDTPLKLITFSDSCRILNEWRNATSVVLFDFHEMDDSDGTLWMLIPGSCEELSVVIPVSSSQFVSFHTLGEFDGLVKNFIRPVFERISHILAEFNKQKQKKSSSSSVGSLGYYSRARSRRRL